MTHNKFWITGAALAATMLAGCASSPTEQAPKLPDWVRKPVVEGGIAASECVNSTSDYGLDKSEAVATARASLAKQIGVQVKAMDKTFQRKVKTESGTITGGTFQSGSKQIADEFLRGTRPMKVQYITMPDGKEDLCAMVGLDPQTTKELFDQLVQQNDKGDNLSPQDESVLYEEFKSQQFQKELGEETS